MKANKKIIILSLKHPDMTLSSDQEQNREEGRWHFFHAPEQSHTLSKKMDGMIFRFRFFGRE